MNSKTPINLLNYKDNKKEKICLEEELKQMKWYDAAKAAFPGDDYGGEEFDLFLTEWGKRHAFPVLVKVEDDDDSVLGIF